MFGIGVPELIIILIVALLVVGPAKLPELARSMGKALGEFRRLADDVKETIEHEMAQEPEKEPEKVTEEQAQVQEEEARPPEQEEEQKTESPMGPLFGDGHIVAEDIPQQEQKAELEAPAENREAAEQNAQDTLAEKIAEGIRINDPQKT